jgi:hypothetical protein
MTTRSRSRIVPLLLLLTALVRAAWLARFSADPLGAVDAEGYHLIARNLLAGHGFAMTWNEPFCPTALRTPLYPLFLAGVYAVLGLDPARAVLVQVLLEVVTTALVIQMGRQIGGRRIGAPAGLLYALNGTTQRYTGTLFSEALLLPVLAAALCVTIQAIRSPKRTHAAAAGALWALALLTKPNVQYLAFTIPLLLVLASRNTQSFDSAQDRHAIRPLLFLAALLIVAAPWLIRNHLVAGRWTLSTAFEENLARVSAVATLAQVRGQRVEPWTVSWEALYSELVAEARQRYAWDARTSDDSVCAMRRRRHREVVAVAREMLRAHPWQAVETHLRGVVRSVLDPGHRTWYPALTGRGWETTGVIINVWQRMGESLRICAVGDALHALWLERVLRPPLSAALLWWGLLTARAVVWVLGLRGWQRLLRTEPVLAHVLAGTVVYVVLLPGPIAYDRFYIPAIPAVVILVVIGLTKGEPGRTRVRMRQVSVEK